MAECHGCKVHAVRADDVGDVERQKYEDIQCDDTQRHPLMGNIFYRLAVVQGEENEKGSRL